MWKRMTIHPLRILGISALAWFVWGGNFLEVHAGSLEPAASPAPTMHTLEQTPPTWEQILPANDGVVSGPLAGCNSSRFTCVMNNTAVRDNETGLVWERTPLTVGQLWFAARFECIRDRTIGGRKGWRMPSVHELASLVDPGNTNPALPTGHPFGASVQWSIYWSATVVAPGQAAAWTVNFSDGAVDQANNTVHPDYLFWCVRGGMNADEY